MVAGRHNRDERRNTGICVTETVRSEGTDESRDGKVRDRMVAGRHNRYERRNTGICGTESKKENCRVIVGVNEGIKHYSMWS